LPEESTDDKDFIATARKRFQQAADDEDLLREEALTDLKYVAGDQWDPKLKQQRENAGRPALTFPRCHTFVQQVSNEARQNKPQIKFAPDDDRADEETAEVYEGMARHIQYESNAQIAYETAVEYSAGGSFGYFRFLTEYCDDESDDLELKIVPVLDPFAVYGILVPACFNRKPKHGFVIEDVPKEEFEDLYPESQIVTGGWEEATSAAPGWIGTDTARIAEYWYWLETVTEKNKSGSRKVRKHTVNFCKMTGMEVFPDSKTTWPGSSIPIIPVLGKGMILQGKPQLFSVVRYQRAAQQMINYAKTRIAETLATAPISPFMVARGQIQKGDKKWENLNTQVYPYVEYEPVDLQGRPAPPPQRQTFEPPIQSLSGFVAQEIDDMKATTGIFDASLGQKSNETSGTAISRRQEQSNMTTMHYIDNLGRSFQDGGNVMAEVMPKIYDTERMVRMLGEDEAPKITRVNAAYKDKNGTSRHYKIGGKDAGKYKVIVTMGRAFSTKRMESFDMMSSVVQGNPQLMPMIGDILFRNSDIAGADQLAERFKKMLPPNLHDQDENDPAAQAQALQGQLAQAQQHLQAINAYAQQLEKEKEGKQVEMSARVEIEKFKAEKEFELKKLTLETQRDVAEIGTKAQDARERAKLDQDLDLKLHTSAHETATQAVEHSHQRAQAAQAAEQARVMAEQGHSNALEQQQAAADSQPAAGDQQ
jgi:hypothetical protein